MANNPKGAILSYSDLFTRDPSHLSESRLVSHVPSKDEFDTKTSHQSIASKKSAKAKAKKAPAKTQSVDNAVVSSSATVSSDEGPPTPKTGRKTPVKAHKSASKSRSAEHARRSSTGRSGKKSPPKKPVREPVKETISEEDESDVSEAQAQPGKGSKTPVPRTSSKTPVPRTSSRTPVQRTSSKTPVPRGSRHEVPRTGSKAHATKSGSKHHDSGAGKNAPKGAREKTPSGKSSKPEERKIVSDTTESEGSETAVTVMASKTPSKSSSRSSSKTEVKKPKPGAKPEAKPEAKPKAKSGAKGKTPSRKVSKTHVKPVPVPLPTDEESSSSQASVVPLTGAVVPVPAKPGPRKVSFEKSATKDKPGKKPLEESGKKPEKPIISDESKSEDRSEDSVPPVAEVPIVATVKPASTKPEAKKGSPKAEAKKGSPKADAKKGSHKPAARQTSTKSIHKSSSKPVHKSASSSKSVHKSSSSSKSVHKSSSSSKPVHKSSSKSGHKSSSKPAHKSKSLLETHPVKEERVKKPKVEEDSDQSVEPVVVVAGVTSPERRVSRKIATVGTPTPPLTPVDRPPVVAVAAIPETDSGSSSSTTQTPLTLQKSKSVILVPVEKEKHHKKKSSVPTKHQRVPPSKPAPAPKKETTAVAQSVPQRRLWSWRNLFSSAPERRYHDEYYYPPYPPIDYSDRRDRYRYTDPASGYVKPKPMARIRRFGQYRLQTKWGPCHPGIAIPIIAVLTLLLRVHPCIIFGIILLYPPSEPTDPGFKALPNSSTNNGIVTKYGPAILFIQAAALIPVCCLLFAAVLRENPLLVLPYIMVQVIAIALWLVLSLASIGTQLSPGDSDDFNGLILITGIGAVFDLWAMMTILTAYMDIKGYRSPWDEESPPPEPKPKTRDVVSQRFIYEDPLPPRRPARRRSRSRSREILPQTQRYPSAEPQSRSRPRDVVPQTQRYASADPMPRSRSKEIVRQSQRYPSADPQSRSRPKDVGPQTQRYASADPTYSSRSGEAMPQRYVPAEPSPRPARYYTPYHTPVNYPEQTPQPTRDRVPKTDPYMDTYVRNLNAGPQPDTRRSPAPSGARRREATSPGPSGYPPPVQGPSPRYQPAQGVQTRYAPPVTPSDRDRPPSARRAQRSDNY